MIDEMLFTISIDSFLKNVILNNENKKIDKHKHKRAHIRIVSSST